MPETQTITPGGQKYYLSFTIKGKKLDPNNIISVTVVERVYEVLPKIDLQLKYDPSFFEQFAIEDNDEFSIEMANEPRNPNITKIDGVIHDYKIAVMPDDSGWFIEITGFLKTKNMFQTQTMSYPSKTSEQVLQEVATDAGLVFKNPQNVIPSDKMNWYQLGQRNLDFIEHVVKRAYIHNDGIFVYANHKGELIYTSLNKEINKTGGKLAKFSAENFSNWNPEEKDETLWYNSYEIINLQGTFNKDSNYGGCCCYYDLTKPVPIEYSDFNKMAELSFIDKELKGKTIFGFYGGFFNNRNMYGETGDGYFESYLRNYFLRNILLGFNIQLNINSVAEVNLFDSIKLDIKSRMANAPDRMYSGNYLITEIQYIIEENGIFQKRIFLSRNGFNKPDQKQFIPRNY